GLGRIAESTGAAERAADNYRKAIAMIESIRAGLQATSLRRDFLADKRDVYDSLIGLLQRSGTPVSELFQWMERSRARTLLDRMAARTPLRELSLEETQTRLPQDTVLIEFWMSDQGALAVWATRANSGAVGYESPVDIQKNAALLLASVQESGNQWR